MMNKDLISLLNTVKLVDVLVTTALLILIVGIILTQKKKIQEIFENWRKKKNFEDTIMDSINELKNVDAGLKDGLEQVWGTMEQSRDTSKEIRKEMYADIKAMSGDLKTVIQKIDEMEEKNRISKRANLKEKIERIYWECHKNMLCTDTAFETLRDLIEDYERYGGDNSFVHSLVIPEMYTWERIKNIPAPHDDSEEEE